jgi:uncharacterized protein YjbI with pentapeptide repeats
MARKAASRTKVPPKVEGKTFVLVGKPGHWTESTAAELIREEGGRVAREVRKGVDFLVLGEPRQREAEEAAAAAERLNGKGAAIRTLTPAEFQELFRPTPEEALALLRGGRADRERLNTLWGQPWLQPTVDLRAANLRGAELSWLSLYGFVLDGADLREADLTRARLPRLRQASLEKAALTGAELAGAAECRFDGADLEGAKIQENCRDCSFREANLGGATFLGDLERCDFTGARLALADFTSLRAGGALFRRADLEQARFKGCDLHGADFEGANLEKALVEETDLSTAVFRKASLRLASLANANLKAADLTETDLRGANLGGADLTGAAVTGAIFEGANVTGAKYDTDAPRKAVGLSGARRAAGRIGTNVERLEQLAGQVERLDVSVTADTRTGAVELGVTALRQGTVVHTREGPPNLLAHGSARRVGEAMLELAGKTQGTPRLQTLKVQARGSPLAPPQLRRLAAAAWSEACGASGPPAGLAAFCERVRTATDLGDLDGALGLLQGSPWLIYPTPESEHVAGVLGQPSPGTAQQTPAVACCRLAADGSFFCCTPKAISCTLQRGRPCRHLLALLLALGKEGRLDPETAFRWLEATRGKKPRVERALANDLLAAYRAAAKDETNRTLLTTDPLDYALL